MSADNGLRLWNIRLLVLCTQKEVHECGSDFREASTGPAWYTDSGCVYVNTGLMQTDVPASGHRLVALALMETYVRYSR